MHIKRTVECKIHVVKNLIMEQIKKKKYVSFYCIAKYYNVSDK